MALASRWAGRGLRALSGSFPEKGAKGEHLPTGGRRSGIQTHDAKNANPQATHPHTYPHTHTQFYLPLVEKMKLPSDTRSALRVSVQFNDD